MHKTCNSTWEEQGGQGESKSGGRHVMHSAAATVCRYVKWPHCQQLGGRLWPWHVIVAASERSLCAAMSSVSK